MYHFIKGKLVEATLVFAVVEVNGMGYKIHLAAHMASHLPQEGNEVLFHTSLVLRENLQALYGFFKKEERDFFELLITIQGIGPKTALNLIGHLGLPEIYSAIQLEKPTTLSKVPGIGKKTADRLLLELKEEVKKFSHLERRPQKVSDGVNALIHLGFSEQRARIAIEKAKEKLDSECDLPTLIKTALQSN